MGALSAALGLLLQAGPLDPRGKIHIPIGIPDARDSLKTFVEGEGNFSPGFATYGIYFWVYDPSAGRLFAPTVEGTPVERGLAGPGVMIPWTSWEAAGTIVRTEICQVVRPSPAGEVQVVGARVRLENRGSEERRLSLFAALRPLGPAGGPVRRLEVIEGALLVDGRAALVPAEKPSAAGVLEEDRIGELVLSGRVGPADAASSERGDASGALRFDLLLPPSASRSLGFLCPVRPGRHAARHRWDGKSAWAQFDLAEPDPPEGGDLQPDPGPDFFRSLRVDDLFEEAAGFWRRFTGAVRLNLPDPRWEKCFRTVAAHVALAMNEGAPDVAVVNYNVFNRDGVYTVNILQKSGRFDLAARAIDYFLAHPFNGRVHPEADNPGQILWILGEHWLFTRDREWLARVYPSVRKLAALIRHCRTAPGPHWVSPTRLEFGKDLPPAERRELKPGSCDGFHPEYTEAFDIAGLRAAVRMGEALGERDDAGAWDRLASTLLEEYDRKFGPKLDRGYGSYCVLWPCRLYPLGEGKAFEQFRRTGARRPEGWRYFPLAAAHQGLLAGNREAGHGTIERHLEHEQMQGWYAFDEGGPSGTGGWNHARTTWKRGKDSVAMPHGWAIAEIHLLMRDCLLFEDGDRLVLLGGIPPGWLALPGGFSWEGLPTHFGASSLRWTPVPGGAELLLSGAAPPGGWILRLPASPVFVVHSEETEIPRRENGDFLLPAGKGQFRIGFRR